MSVTKQSLVEFLYQFFDQRSKVIDKLPGPKGWGRILTDEIVFMTGELVPDSPERERLEEFFHDNALQFQSRAEKASLGHLVQHPTSSSPPLAAMHPLSLRRSSLKYNPGIQRSLLLARAAPDHHG